jgi:predicted DNA binding CopG/RHH family protein
MKPKTPQLALARPTTTKKTTEAARAAAKLEDGDARLVVNLPERLHRSIKMRAVEQGVTIREYVLGLLERDGHDMH